MTFADVACLAYGKRTIISFLGWKTQESKVRQDRWKVTNTSLDSVPRGVKKRLYPIAPE